MTITDTPWKSQKLLKTLLLFVRYKGVHTKRTGTFGSTLRRSDHPVTLCDDHWHSVKIDKNVKNLTPVCSLHKGSGQPLHTPKRTGNLKNAPRKNVDDKNTRQPFVSITDTPWKSYTGYIRHPISPNFAKLEAALVVVAPWRVINICQLTNLHIKRLFNATVYIKLHQLTNLYIQTDKYVRMLNVWERWERKQQHWL